MMTSSMQLGMMYGKHAEQPTAHRRHSKLVGIWGFHTLESVIDVGQGINVGPGNLGKKNKRRALNTHVLCSE